MDPTCKQRRYFANAAGCARFVWNTALDEWNRRYQAGEKPNGPALKKEFNEVKYQLFPWLRDVHRDCHSQPFATLQKAFTAFFQKKAAHPTFKRKGEHDAFYVSNDKFQAVGNQVRLPVIGTVRLTEELRFSGKIMSATVSREADRWFVAVQVDVGDYSKPRTGDGIVGVDLGVTTAVTLSTGEKIDGPKPLKKKLKRLRVLSRRHSRKQKGSKRRAKSQMRLARLHRKIRNIRQDFLHKVTTRLCRENQAVAIEDLNVKGMTKNHCLARSISDVGFGEFRRQMEYKAPIYRTQLHVVDRWLPSSKICNACGAIRAKLTLSDRVFQCPHCGHTEDRDVNAAQNLRDDLEAHTAGLAGIYARGDGSSGSDTSPCETTLSESGTRPCSL